MTLPYLAPPNIRTGDKFRRCYSYLARGYTTLEVFLF